MAIIHLYSVEILKSISIMNKVFPFDFIDGCNHYITGTKLSLIHKYTGRECLGHVINETDVFININVESAIIISLPTRALFNNS